MKRKIILAFGGKNQQPTLTLGNIAQQELALPVKLGSAAPFVPLLTAVFPNCISDPPEGESMRLIY